MLVQRTLDLIAVREAECAARGVPPARAGMLRGSEGHVHHPLKRSCANGLQAAQSAGAMQPAVKQMRRSAANAAETDTFGQARVVAIRFDGPCR